MPKLQTFTSIITGTPRPLPRPKFYRGRVVSMPRGAKARVWRRTLCLQIGQDLRTAQAHGDWPENAAEPVLSCDVTFVFNGVGNSKAGGEPAWLRNRPDLDNLVKMVLDAAQDVGVMRDDMQVVEFSSRKVKVPDVEPFARVTFTRLDGPPDLSRLLPGGDGVD